ncbi:MAG: hypothetical protein R3Y09_12465 [Clostridia bacterium]
MKPGRPPKLNADGQPKYDIETMCNKIEEYLQITKKSVPILKECCLINNWSYDYVIELKEKNDILSQSVKRIYDQAEVNYEKMAVLGKVAPAWAIFKLKQPVHGWTDKYQVQNDVAINKVNELLEKIENDID